jgi:hypothetical protein
MTTLAPVLQAFFTERLMAQRRASSHAITGYRDTLRLLRQDRQDALRAGHRRPGRATGRRLPRPPGS